jgi:putative peptidoglycan lipid II flippase
MLQLRVFYALRDARTPAFINFFMVGTKVVIVLICDHLFDDPAKIAVALTVATSASYVIGAVTGHFLLSRRLGNLQFGGPLATAGRVLVASALGGVAAFGVELALTNALGNGRAGAVSTLTLGSVAGLIVLAVVVWRMRIPEIQDIVAIARRR